MWFSDDNFESAKIFFKKLTTSNRKNMLTDQLTAFSHYLSLSLSHTHPPTHTHTLFSYTHTFLMCIQFTSLSLLKQINHIHVRFMKI